jgi:hypothetical protein
MAWKDATAQALDGPGGKQSGNGSAGNGSTANGSAGNGRIAADAAREQT